MNNKAKGTRLERKIADLLEALGYDVTRAAGSHGLWDLVATHPTHVRYIQVKAEEVTRVTSRLLADLPVHDITIADPPIEDVIEQAFNS